MEEEERVEQVMSEVHLGCPPHFSGPYVSHFTVSLPPTPNRNQRVPCTFLQFYHAFRHTGSGDRFQVEASSKEMVTHDDHSPKRKIRCSYSQSSTQFPQEDTSDESPSLDKDCDLVLTRRKSHINGCLTFGLTIQHTITSSLLEVGLQVWKAALVLTDFILHKSFTSSDLNDVTAIELGAGTGLVGIALARVAKTVYITDRGVHILDNCDTNTHINSSLLKFHENCVRVRELDWKESWPPPSITADLSSQHRSSKSRYLWASLEIEEAENATVLLAADVIYSDELTDSFFSMVEKLMSRGSQKVLYLALEKRYNFSMDELDVVANGYSHFRSFFVEDEDHAEHIDGLRPGFLGKQIDLAEIPQYIREYERGKDLELWKITCCRN